VYGLADIGSHECRTHDTDAGVNEETSGPRQNMSVNPTPQLLGFLSRENRCALDGHTACQQDLVANGYTGLPHKAGRGDFAEHLPDQDWAVQALSDFGVAASQGDTQFVARAPHIGHYRLGQFGRCATFRKEHDDKKPEGACAHDGNIVGVDVNCVTPDLIGGEGDGIGGDDEIKISSIDDRRILANLRSNEQARIMLRRMIQQRPQVLDRKFADWQNLLRLALSHVLMIIDEAV
jgi:hypothetical protein